MNTTKDFLKVLYCKAGYAKNIKVERYYGEGWTVCYKMSGENKEGDVLMLEGTASEIIDDYLETYKRDGDVDVDWIGSELKYMANDEIRNSIVKQNEERDRAIQESIKRLSPAYEWAHKNNPCPKCNNKKEINDIVHDNCEYCANGASGYCFKIDLYRAKHQIYVNIVSNRNPYMYVDHEVLEKYGDELNRFIENIETK